MDIKRFFIVALALAVMLPLAATGSLTSLTIDLAAQGARGVPAGWKLFCADRSTTCYFTQDEGVAGFCIRTDDSKNSVQRRVDVDVAQYPVITWRWMVKELPAEGDCRNAETDDQAAQLYVAFDGKDVVGYTWDSNAPVGHETEYRVKLLRNVKTIVVKSGDSDKGKWVTVTRNLAEDYEALYGKKPVRAKGLSFQANSQHTDTIAEACIEKIQFMRGELRAER